jgi:hypothetical protein
MSFESLQRAAEAAGFATASDDNQDAPIGVARKSDAAPLSYPASLLAPARTPRIADAAAAASQAAVWSRASLGQFIPTWAVRS